MLRTISLSILFVVTLLQISACTPKVQKGVKREAGINIDAALADSASSVEESLRILASTQKSYTNRAINTSILTTPQGGMGGTASIDWSGPIEPLLEKIAHMSHYRVKYIGNPPPIPVIVSITKNEAIVADLIKDAGLQAGNRANIVVYPADKIIELRYATS